VRPAPAERVHPARTIGITTGSKIRAEAAGGNVATERAHRGRRFGVAGRGKQRRVGDPRAAAEAASRRDRIAQRQLDDAAGGALYCKEWQIVPQLRIFGADWSEILRKLDCWPACRPLA
jgi:hypothetical protein